MLKRSWLNAMLLSVLLLLPSAAASSMAQSDVAAAWAETLRTTPTGSRDLFPIRDFPGVLRLPSPELVRAQGLSVGESSYQPRADATRLEYQVLLLDQTGLERVRLSGSMGRAAFDRGSTDPQCPADRAYCQWTAQGESQPYGEQFNVRTDAGQQVLVYHVPCCQGGAYCSSSWATAPCASALRQP